MGWTKKYIMRIIGYIEHPTLKITIFNMDSKFSIKFETGMYEQTYKLRPTPSITGIDEIKKLVDAAFIEEVLAEFGTLNRIRNSALERFLPKRPEDEFEKII